MMLSSLRSVLGVLKNVQECLQYDPEAKEEDVLICFKALFLFYSYCFGWQIVKCVLQKPLWSSSGAHHYNPTLTVGSCAERN